MLMLRKMAKSSVTDKRRMVQIHQKLKSGMVAKMVSPYAISLTFNQLTAEKSSAIFVDFLIKIIKDLNFAPSAFVRIIHLSILHDPAG